MCLAKSAKKQEGIMTSAGLSDRYLALTDKLERITADTKLVQREICEVMDAMTDDEIRETAKRLRPSQSVMAEALERHLQQRYSAPVE
jgi:hypothetical protein